MKQTSGNNIAWPGQKAKESKEEGKRIPTENGKVQIIRTKLNRLKLGLLELARSSLTVLQSKYLLPFLVPELRDKLLKAFTQRRLLIRTHQPTAIQEKLSQRRTEEKKKQENHSQFKGHDEQN